MSTFKIVIYVLTSITLGLACETKTDIIEISEVTATKKSNLKHVTAFNVRVELEDRYGDPVGPNGLQGYFAIEQETGEVFYPTRSYDDNVFENLPEGTYHFGAYDGYFDGASSSVVTLAQDLIDDNGFVVVTLRYWSE